MLDDTAPLVSVLMPVYNSERYLREAMDSILNQTYTNYEFIIVNDASSDNSKEIVTSFQDSRIKLIDFSVNKGIAYSLNLGIEQSKGKYIIRMDSDDISLPSRIKEQVKYMESHQNVGVSACLVEGFGGETKRQHFPAIGSDEVKCEMLFNSTIAHPAVIMRAETIKKNEIKYNENYVAEDYGFWIDALNFTKITVYPKVLLRYRISDTSLSVKALGNALQRKKTMIDIYDKIIQMVGFKVSEAEMEMHYSFSDYDFVNCNVNYSDQDLKKYLYKLIEQNHKSKYFDSAVFKNILGKKWLVYIARRRNFSAGNILCLLSAYGLVHLIKKGIGYGAIKLFDANNL